MTPAEIENLLRSRGVKAVQLASTQGLPSRSKLGGLPDVPRDFTWPVWNGRPLSFVAQVDLSTLPPLETLPGLPAQGMLYFFYELEESPWGYDPKDLGGWRVLYCPDPSTLSTAAAPPDLNGNFIYKEKQVGPRAISSFPDFGSLGPSMRDFAVEAVDVEYQLRSAEFAEAPEHQMGGFPHPIQGDEMELEAQLASNGLYCGDSTGYQDPRARVLAEGAKDWRLLLQVDYDSDTDMEWGDGGRLYFWIRTQELAQRDFSKVWMILQCF